MEIYKILISTFEFGECCTWILVLYMKGVAFFGNKKTVITFEGYKETDSIKMVFLVEIRKSFSAFHGNDDKGINL